MKFHFHYNKPKSLQEKKPKISLHFKNKCFIVDALECNVPTNSKFNKKQPFFVMTGDAKKITIKNKKAFITQ